MALGGGGGGFTGAYDAVPSITAAYGMRRLRSAYTGSIVRIRRSSDNTEQDFGYDAAGDLDTAAIATFIGGGSGYIVTWYDQSGNGNDATQSAAASQPLYVASGQNSKSVLRFDGSDDRLDTSFALSGTQASFLVTTNPVTTQSILRFQTQNDVYVVYPWLGGGETDKWIISNDGGTQGLETGLVENQWNVGIALYTANTVNGKQTYRNGSLVAQANSLDVSLPTPALIIGRYQSREPFEGDVSEIVIASAAWSIAQRQAAESAANAYWSVF